MRRSVQEKRGFGRRIFLPADSMRLREPLLLPETILWVMSRTHNLPMSC